MYMYQNTIKRAKCLFVVRYPSVGLTLTAQAIVYAYVSPIPDRIDGGFDEEVIENDGNAAEPAAAITGIQRLQK